jgi:hypothetical protein
MNRNVRRLSKTTRNREVEASRIETSNPIPKLARKVDKENKELLNEAKGVKTRAEKEEIAEIRKRNSHARNLIGKKAVGLGG